MILRIFGEKMAKNWNLTNIEIRGIKHHILPPFDHL